MSSAIASEEPRLAPTVSLAVRPLSVVPEGDEFIVGDPESSVFVVLPAVGVEVIDLLRTRRSLAAVSAEAERSLGQEIDVYDFAESLLDLGFATIADPEAAPVTPAAVAAPPRWLRLAFSRAAWIVYGGAALGVIALFAASPGLFPRASDLFFLGTPARSLAALTLITYTLAAAHELCHWLAARAEGVGSRIAVGRRLYFLVLEIDLSGLWSLPRRRRYSALCAGMAFDAMVLLPILVARLGDEQGWWTVGPAAAKVLAALTFVEFAAILSQFWIFARTDVYALLITATGCINLFRVNQLMVRRSLRLITADQREELAASHERDVAVARWFRWIYVLGITAAAWFFVVFFVPATIRLATWIGGSVAHAGPGSEHFWEALLFGALLFSPRVLTLGVAVRDLRRWRERRAVRA